MNALLARCRSVLLALSAALAMTFTLGAAPAQAGITTPEILMDTITALPACLKYEVKGMCFFLKCGWTGCRIRSSIRIQHYVPDVIVSTYNSPEHHPWVEVGRPIAAVGSLLGSATIGGIGGSFLDASADTANPIPDIATFKNADAIGNPVGQIAQVMKGGLPDLPESFGVPGTAELMKFPSQELPGIGQRWASVPQNLMNSTVAQAAEIAKVPGEIIDSISKVPATLGRLQSSAGDVGKVLRGGIEIGDVAGMASKIAGIDLGPLQDVVGAAETLADSSSLGTIFCPGAASAFKLQYQSDVDSLFWRGVIPVELLYPESWVATLNEVSKSPMVSTWGGRYPRTGELIQNQPVKASAVLAERVASIITQEAQPHIYQRLQAGGDFRYFKKLADTRWQMLYPEDSGDCMTFGENDSVALKAFGDGNTSSDDGYVWNMWNKYDCCDKRGSYLFSVP